jgi:TRAP-type transport system periplasmic protein
MQSWQFRTGRLMVTRSVAFTGLAALLVAGCNATGASKAGGAPQVAPSGTITLTFTSADPLPVDTTFATLVDKDSGGHLRLHDITYNGRSTSVDETIAADLTNGKLDAADVGSRAWESLGVLAFSAYQDPFLITSRELLDASVTGELATGLLTTLKTVGITGLAIVPDSIRYLYSTRPLTSPDEFAGAKIGINASQTTSEILGQLKAQPVTDIEGGPATVQALRDGALTAIESSPFNALENGYVQAAPYVTVNLPLFAKTTTFAINSAELARLPARDADALRLAAQQAAATQATSSADRTWWASACGEGLKPVAVTQQQFDAFHAAEALTYAELAGDTATTLAIDRIGGLAASEPRMDSWATCNGIGVAATSPTAVLDGTYAYTLTQAQVAAAGDCTECGNAGTYKVVIGDGRYAIYHPVSIDSNPQEPSVAAFAGWRPDDPVEVGTISIAGDQATFVPEVNQQYGSVTSVYTFSLFRGVLTWQRLSGENFDTTTWTQVTG